MPMFEPREAQEAFRQFLAARGLDEAALSVRDGLEAMLDFYRDMRADGCALENDADMLLFQWGTYSTFPRAGGIAAEAFDLNLTRQLILDEGGEDDDIWQLALNFEFEPSGELGALGRGNKWCHTLQELPPFRNYVLASPPVTTCSKLQIERRTLKYGCAG